jgi:ATP-dependent RNA helicase DeaD
MSSTKTFSNLGVPQKILQALTELGYENPFPIQAQSIPILMQGKDLLAQAQTGTGKTAAFAIPILANLVLEQKYPQALILTPTRELALQVAETFRSYAKHMAGFHVLPIYGGQDFHAQLKAFKRGVHVIVGTPGRLIDHLEQRTLSIDKIKTVILDEADEMLKMGFIDDVKWILQKVSAKHQTALFSATIPMSIKKVASQYLQHAQEISISPEIKTVTAIEQQYMLVANQHKLEALTRFLEVEEFDAVLIFTRTKNLSSELAEKLEARGYAAAAVNGDMKQNARERVIKQIKNKTIDIVVGTDVAARGLDIDRISHVISYDAPYDTDSYVHRIGRTGRAGRKGKALLLITPRERRMLKDIERAVGKNIAAIEPPSALQINEKHAADFTIKVLQVLQKEDLDNYRELVEIIVQKSECSELDVAAALARIAQKERPFQPMQDDRIFKQAIQKDEQQFSSGGFKKKGKRNRNFKHKFKRGR